MDIVKECLEMCTRVVVYLAEKNEVEAVGIESRAAGSAELEPARTGK